MPARKTPSDMVHVARDGRTWPSTNRAGAIWSPERLRYECHIDRCTRKAIRGTNMCSEHGGLNNRGITMSKMAQGRRDARQIAVEMAELYDIAVDDIPPLSTATAMRTVLQQSQLLSRVLNQLVSEQIEDEGVEGVVGLKYGSDGQGGRIVVGEEVRALLLFRDQHEALYTRQLEAAHKMGIAEREIELRSGEAERVVRDVLESLRRAGLTDEVMSVVVDDLAQTWSTT